MLLCAYEYVLEKCVEYYFQKVLHFASHKYEVGNEEVEWVFLMSTQADIDQISMRRVLPKVVLK